MPILQTERLIIRPFTMNDLNEAYAVLEGHPDVWRFDPGRQRTLEERRDALQYRIWEYENKGIGCMAVTLKETASWSATSACSYTSLSKRGAPPRRWSYFISSAGISGAKVTPWKPAPRWCATPLSS